MIKNKILAILAIGILVMGACQQQAPSELSAALSELEGLVEFKKAGSDSFAPAAANSIMAVNDQLQTGDDGRVRLDLSSGTIIRVAPSSSFTLVSNEPAEGGLITKIKLEAGKIFIILNGGSADVETPSGVASVRGSYMKVEVDPDNGDVYVTCLEGDCSGENPAGGVEFTAGEKTILFHQDENGNWQVPGVEDMTPEDFQEWLDNNPEAKELFEQAMGTATAMAAQPTATATPENTATPEPTIVSSLPEGGSSSACKTIEPVEGASLPHQGKVKFQWEPQPGANKYVVTFVDANGLTVSFETTDTSLEKYIEILPGAGNYDWYVAAYGEDGGEICKSETVEFSKPDSKPQPEPKKEEEEGSACDPDPYCSYFEGDNCCSYLFQ